MLLQGYGIAAADRVKTRYSWERIGQDTLAVYEGSCKAAAAV
jgi:glycosyltransferase involved in cell wall biosynthesis